MRKDVASWGGPSVAPAGGRAVECTPWERGWDPRDPSDEARPSCSCRWMLQQLQYVVGIVRLVRLSRLVRMRVSPRSHPPVQRTMAVTNTSVLVQKRRPPWLRLVEKKLPLPSRLVSSHFPLREPFLVRKTSTTFDGDRSGTSSRWSSFRLGTTPTRRDVSWRWRRRW